MVGYRSAAGRGLSAGRAQSRSTPVTGTSGAFALLFPSNVSGGDTAAPYAVIQFARPDLNGLPPMGPGNAGVTIIRKIRPDQQTGYYAQDWYTQGDGEAPINGELYYGAHPYPTSGTNQGTSHEWEIATEGGDFRAPVSGGNIAVDKGTTVVQALRIEYNGGAPIMTFYPTLPSMGNTAKIVRPCNAGYASASIPSPLFTIGDSPWFATNQHERASCAMDVKQIYARALSDAEILQAIANFAVPLSGVWWAKNGFNSRTDLTCPTTGRAFTLNDSSNLITTTARL